ncbi:MAG: hypothetical protein RJS98_02610 [Rhodospirillaceae bacterium]
MMENIVSTEDASELLENKEGFVILVYDAKDEEGDGQGGAGNMRALYDLCETIAEKVQAKELRQIDFLSCPEVYDHCRNWFKEKVSKTLPHQLPVVVYGDGDYLGFFNSAKIDDCFDEFEETEIDIDLPFPLEHAKEKEKKAGLMFIGGIAALVVFLFVIFSGGDDEVQQVARTPEQIEPPQEIQRAPYPLPPRLVPDSEVARSSSLGKFDLIAEECAPKLASTYISQMKNRFNSDANSVDVGLIDLETWRIYGAKDPAGEIYSINYIFQMDVQWVAEVGASQMDQFRNNSRAYTLQDSMGQMLGQLNITLINGAISDANDDDFECTYVDMYDSEGQILQSLQDEMRGAE